MTLDIEGVVDGGVVEEPALILSWIEKRVGAVERIVHESGPVETFAPILMT